LNLKVPRKKKQKHKDIGIEQKVNTIKSLMFYLNDIEFYIKELYINEKESYHRHYMLTKFLADMRRGLNPKANNKLEVMV
jgi:hypothetical protein